MKLFCASSTSKRFKEGEWYSANFFGGVFNIRDEIGAVWQATYDDESGFILVEMVGGDFVEFE